MASFEEILNKPASEIEAPKAYPVGTYHTVVNGVPEPTTSSKKQTPGLIFKLKVMRPMEDVDAQAAAESQVVGKDIRHTLWITDGSAFMLKQFLEEHLGIETGNKSLKEMIGEAPNQQCLVKLKHRISDDGQRVFAEVESTAHV